MSQPNATPGSPTTPETPATPPVRTSAKNAARSGQATLTVDDAGAAAATPTTVSGGSAGSAAGASAGASGGASGEATTAKVGSGTSGATPSGTTAKPKPAPRTAPAPRTSGGARRVRLSVSRVDPWSVMKLGFLLSVALGIITVVAAAVAWKVLDSMGVFADLESLINDLGAMKQFGVILEYLRLKNIMSMAVIVAIIDVALITALSTLMAFIYNIVAALVGGLHLTLTDD